MKVKYHNFVGCDDPNWVSVAFRYGEDRPWHIYEGASYDIKKEVDLKELIQEVMQERHVSRKNIKIVKPRYVMFQEVT